MSLARPFNLAWRSLRRAAARGTLFALLAMAATSDPATAHPHVWVTVESTVLFGPDKAITGIRHKWTFDELYTSFAIQGLDKKGGNNPTREDLKELAELNVESLKEFAYFTYAEAATAAGGRDKAPLAAPVDYFLEHQDGLLSLHFTLPLAKAVRGEQGPFAFAVYDPSYFIALQFAKDKPVQLGQGAPKGCVAELKQQPGQKAAGDKLAEAFSGALGPASGGGLAGDSAVVTCKEKG